MVTNASLLNKVHFPREVVPLAGHWWPSVRTGSCAGTALPAGTVRVEQLWKRFPRSRRLLLRDEVEWLIGRWRGTYEGRWHWALREVSFDITPGEAVGLIGANGSGKSTLLKVLSRVMYPYSGRIQVRGRVGALIEVMAGLHTDLTGRENIYLYGSLLGWQRREVGRRFDDIVDFVELADAVDRQVKFYSSGMQMRLGFAVAALLGPDVLLVDEVLAVGDAAFQQRCLDRMGRCWQRARRWCTCRTTWPPSRRCAHGPSGSIEGSCWPTVRSVTCWRATGRASRWPRSRPTGPVSTEYCVCSACRQPGRAGAAAQRGVVPASGSHRRGRGVRGCDPFGCQRGLRVAHLRGVQPGSAGSREQRRAMRPDVPAVAGGAVLPVGADSLWRVRAVAALGTAWGACGDRRRPPGLPGWGRTAGSGSSGGDLGGGISGRGRRDRRIGAPTTFGDIQKRGSVTHPSVVCAAAVCATTTVSESERPPINCASATLVRMVRYDAPSHRRSA